MCCKKMKMFYMSLCLFCFATAHVQSESNDKKSSAINIDLEFIQRIVVAEVENWAPIIKQTIVYNENYESALPVIWKVDQSAKIINVFDLLLNYLANEETRKKVPINVIGDLITDCFECMCLKSLSLFALIASKDFVVKKYNATINNDDDKVIGENQDEKVDKKRFPEVKPQSLPYTILQMEKTLFTMIRKLTALNLTYELPLEVYKVIYYGQRTDGVAHDNYLNSVLCVLEKTIKIVDDLLTKKCVDHQGSLAKKYDVFLDDDRKMELKQFITALGRDPNAECNSQCFANFVAFAEKAIKETNSIALYDEIELPKDLALFDKCSNTKTTFDQDDIMELILDDPFGETSLSEEYLERRMLDLNYEFDIPGTEENNSVDDDDEDEDMLVPFNYEERNSDYIENDNNLFKNEGCIKHVDQFDHDKTGNSFLNENDQLENYLENVNFNENSQLENFLGNDTVDRLALNDIEMLKSDDKDDETGNTFLNPNSQLMDFIRKEMDDRSNDVEVLKNDDSSHTAHNETQ